MERKLTFARVLLRWFGRDIAYKALPFTPCSVAIALLNLMYLAGI
ncbi:MAG TPA: hypothetical protein V6C90_11095 [Coleofasciculaceae cyanobacterium]